MSQPYTLTLIGGNLDVSLGISNVVFLFSLFVLDATTQLSLLHHKLIPKAVYTLNLLIKAGDVTVKKKTQIKATW